MSEEKKNEILEEKLDESELNAVSGGAFEAIPQNKGNCSNTFFKEKCKMTVENGSWCSKVDYCFLISEKYTRP